jgi:hypothetical protein
VAQHDFNIANQGFPATRADINNAFQAIASNSSGPTAPSTTYANQWWYDTTNDKMYLRNAADSAWIEVAVLDQTNGEWKITTGVVQAKDSDGLALKTDDGTTRLFIQDSDGSIGIGTTSPSNRLQVNTTAADSQSTGTIVIEKPNFTSGSATHTALTLKNASIGQGLDLGLFTDSGGNRGSFIDCPSAELGLSFRTSGTERMRILSGGGLTFNGDTAAANALDDYEEGTWTPTLTATGTNPTVTYVAPNTAGIYIKIGPVVHYTYEVRTSAVSGGSGNIVIGGLPYARATASPDGDRSTIDMYNVSFPTGASYMVNNVPQSGSTMSFLGIKNGAGHADTPLSNWPSSGLVLARATGWYYTG